ncbi:hypothetical protein [uncultured Brevundimonas sp.]|jgi:hypothetical protein|nr:hypothetical protein [uncultured Brevundimonas sp.]
MKRPPLGEVLLWAILVIGAIGAVLSALAIFAVLGLSLFRALLG